MTVSFTFLWRFLWYSTFEHLIEDKVSISTVTGWLTQQDTCFTCILYFGFRTPSFLPRPDDAKVCLWFSPQVCWLSHAPFFSVSLCFLCSPSFPCFVPHVWFDYRFLQTVSLGLVLCYNCGLNEVSINAFWCLKLPWSPLLVQLCRPLSWQFVRTVVLLSWHVLRWKIMSAFPCDGAGSEPLGFTTKFNCQPLCVGITLLPYMWH